MLGTHMDVTERKQAEEAVHLAKEAAEAASLAKTEFLANMSHEIRTPLNGILGIIQVLEDTPLNEDQRECLKIGLNSGRSLLRIIGDILDLSKIESGKMEVREEEFTPSEIIQSIQGAFLNEAMRKGLVANYHVSPALPLLLVGDSGRIRQILFNLVGNALKFTEQGEVSVRVYPEGVDANPSRFDLCFDVSDTGIGIPKDKLESIFEPFTQADGSYTRRFGGTGLGLSIIKRFTELLGGTVRIESEEGVGTTVSFRIPVKAAEGGESVAEEGSATTVALPFALKILLAEDDLSNQLVAKRLLEKQGHTVVSVATGIEALDAVRKERFDLVLMDVQMPEMEGSEATKEIRKETRFKDLPIIALTAHAMSGDKERFMEAGMNGYLSKPIDMEELAKVLGGVIGK
jgi:CheY-like chemotaxis protein